MIEVSPAVHFAAHRFGLVSALGARKVGAYSREVPSAADPVSEFALPGGEVVSRRVPADGTCWLSADLAWAAERALHAEQEENARVAAEVIAWSLGRDQRRADEQGVTLEQYRQKRNAIGHRQSGKRGLQNAGMS